MPIQRRDAHSGALIFDLTPDEITVKQLSRELEEKSKLVDEKLALLDKVIKEVSENESKHS